LLDCLLACFAFGVSPAPLAIAAICNFVVLYHLPQRNNFVAISQAKQDPQAH
jgi:hypothetical protein